MALAIEKKTFLGLTSEQAAELMGGTPPVDKEKQCVGALTGEEFADIVGSGGGGGGGGGTTNYNSLSNKPSINNIALTGNKTAAQLQLASASAVSQAQSDAATALSNASQAKVAAQNAATTASVAQTQATQNKTSINTLNTKVASLETDVASKASQSDVDTLSADLNTKATKGELQTLSNTVDTKADKTTVTTLSATVDTKADQSDLDALSGTVANKASQSDVDALNAYPKIYSVYGQILTSGSAMRGNGTATVTLFANKTCRIEFSAKITTAGTNASQFNCGLSSNMLKSLNSNIPTITPVKGGVLEWYGTDGIRDKDNLGYGGTLEASSGQPYWKFARMYQTSGTIGPYPETECTVGKCYIGTAYGTWA